MILVVNDNAATTAPFCRVLKWAELPHLVVDNLDDAYAALAREDWTGFIFDVYLPGGTGVDLLEALRQIPRYADTPVAVTTANILLPDALALRIAEARATLYVGVFDRSTINEICLNLHFGRRDT
jgi:CheY-like chemotaxis protein